MHSIGFTLYSEMLAQTVKMLKAGKKPDLNKPLVTGSEVNLRIPALLPDTYLPDVHGRLLMYKRLANAMSELELKELKVEMIDRFGLLPEPTLHLFAVTSLRLRAQQLGIDRIEATASGGKLRFAADTRVDPLSIVQLVQKQSGRYALAGANELRFRHDSHSPEQRIAAVDQLLALFEKSSRSAA